MADVPENQWSFLLGMLAAGGFVHGVSVEDDTWPDSFPTREITWQGAPATAVTLPNADQWLVVRPSFWQSVVEQARRLRGGDTASPPRTASSDPDDLRRQLVAHLLQVGSLTDPTITRAMLQVPRHLFLPNESLDRAYANEAVVTHKDGAINISSASQPAMVAIMLEQLGIKPGMRVLEIGAGTGYNAALLAELVGPNGHVTTIDIDQHIVDEARRNLDSAGYNTVRTVCGDGAAGFASAALYDRIVLTVGAYDIAPAWREQLVEGGVLLLPLTLGAGEQSIAFERRGAVLHSRSAFSCGFIRLRGLMTPPELRVVVADGALICIINEAHGIAAAALEATLSTQPQMVTLPTRLGNWQRWSSLSIFCAAHGDCLVQCFDRRGLLGQPDRMLVGLYAPADTSVVLLDPHEDRAWAFGGAGALTLLRQRLHDMAARPTQQLRLHIEAVPAGGVAAPPAGAALIRRPFSDLVVWL